MFKPDLKSMCRNRNGLKAFDCKLFGTNTLTNLKQTSGIFYRIVIFYNHDYFKSI